MNCSLCPATAPARSKRRRPPARSEQPRPPARSERQRRRTCAAFIAFSTVLFTGACGPGSNTNDAGNLLVITIDTLRADRLGAYGYAGAETPAMDRLASEGVRFSHAVTAAPTTLPSHATIFTGMTPPRHGVRDNAAGVLPAAALTLAEQFRGSGFNTGAFVSAFVLDSRWGLLQGFDVYDGTPVAPGEAPASPQESERIGEQTTQAALTWIESQRGENWFAWVHLFDPHAPYVAPEPYRSRYAADPYDGEVAYTDSLIAEIRARLESLGMWADTTVILTADHGEALHEHGEPAHGFFLYESTLRVPLIVRLANNATGEGFSAAAGRGAVVDTAVGVVDIFPTVAELWGFDASDPVEGRSLVPALQGASIDTVPIYSETMLPELYFGWHSLRAITAGDHKFIEAPCEELYDLVADPGEANNMADAQPARAGELRDQLVAMVERSEAGAIDGGATMDPDRIAALRSLGYLGVGGSSDNGDLADPKDKIEVYAAMMAALGEWQAGKIEEALRIIDEQIVADPAFAGAVHFRGVILAGSGRYAEAATAFERARDADPEHAPPPRGSRAGPRLPGDGRLGPWRRGAAWTDGAGAARRRSALGARRYLAAGRALGRGPYASGRRAGARRRGGQDALRHRSRRVVASRQRRSGAGGFRKRPRTGAVLTEPELSEGCGAATARTSGRVTCRLCQRNSAPTAPLPGAVQSSAAAGRPGSASRRSNCGAAAGAGGEPRRAPASPGRSFFSPSPWPTAATPPIYPKPKASPWPASAS